METLAALFRAPGAPLSIERIVLDPPAPTEVLVRLSAVGLCRTDLHVARGERPVAMRPMVLGHEGAGIVEAVGAEVVGIAVGDHVVLTFIPACGRCRWCKVGMHHLCVEGAKIARGPQLDGTYRRRDAAGADVGAFCVVGAFAERTVVDQASVVVIDRDVPLDHASLVACGVPAGVGAARHRARVRRGDSVLVVGVGGDGMNVVQGARMCGAATIVAADLVADKLALARGFGATHGTTEPLSDCQTSAAESPGPACQYRSDPRRRPCPVRNRSRSVPGMSRSATCSGATRSPSSIPTSSSDGRRNSQWEAWKAPTSAAPSKKCLGASTCVPRWFGSEIRAVFAVSPRLRAVNSWATNPRPPP